MSYESDKRSFFVLYSAIFSSLRSDMFIECANARSRIPCVTIFDLVEPRHSMNLLAFWIATVVSFCIPTPTHIQSMGLTCQSFIKGASFSPSSSASSSSYHPYPKLVLYAHRPLPFAHQQAHCLFGSFPPNAQRAFTGPGVARRL